MMIDVITTSNNYWQKRHTKIISNLIVSFFIYKPLFSRKKAVQVLKLWISVIYTPYIYIYIYIYILKQKYCKNRKLRSCFSATFWFHSKNMTHSTKFIILFMTNIFAVRIFLIACLTNIFVVRSERVNVILMTFLVPFQEVPNKAHYYLTYTSVIYFLALEI